MINTNDERNLSQNGVNRILNIYNGKKIYIRARVWGVSGNHEEIIFSENPINIADKERNYIFYTDEVFYNLNNNDLTIYAPNSGKSIPKTHFTSVSVKFISLKNYDEIKDYSENYKKYGVKKISIYNQ